uniref:Putative glycoside hydrolase n=1 Tax=viral metagenome TaxID=1070528 RepID=A0A6M3KSR6_9ZZZZ
MKEQTKDFEGFRSTIYDDTKGKKTIGYGFNLTDKAISKYIPLDVRLGKRPITQEESDIIFDKLYANAEKDASKFVGVETFAKLQPQVKDTLIDMSYNLGYNKLTGFQEFRKALINNDMQKAAYELKNSKWYGQVGRRSEHHYEVIKNTKPVRPWKDLLNAKIKGE